MQWDVVVIGAGAAGLLAAARAAERGRRTLLLEKNPRAGTKILMSGGTRCNLTQATDNRGIVEAFGSQGRFLHSALASLSPNDLVDMIEAEGVTTKTEEAGKIFPASNQAQDVLDALLNRLERSGCRLALEESVQKLTNDDDGFKLHTTRQTIPAKRVIVTTGGKSYPGSGTSGDGYPWLSGLGHKITQLRPALTPVTTNVSWIANLSGLTISDVAVRVIDNQDDRPIALAKSRDSFLFTHFGLSGPSVLDISRAVTAHDSPQSLQLECDFLPSVSFESLLQQLRSDCDKAGKKQLLSILSRWIPRRLAESILEQLKFSNLRAAELSKKKSQQLIAGIKQTRIPISGTRGFKKAEVTAGGVSLDEIDSRTMQSKINPNLFVAGEILDLDGPIGGYNFQAAFSTAWLAGESV